jgi:hypothetical protein
MTINIGADAMKEKNLSGIATGTLLFLVVGMPAGAATIEWADFT